MNTLTNNLNKELFTELTPTESAAINGGEQEYRGGVTEFIEAFEVEPGADLKLSTFTDTSNNTGFFAELLNPDGQKHKLWIPTGNKTTYWRDLKGGLYAIDFRDGQKDVRGTRGGDSFVLNSGNY